MDQPSYRLRTKSNIRAFLDRQTNPPSSLRHTLNASTPSNARVTRAYRRNVTTNIFCTRTSTQKFLFSDFKSKLMSRRTCERTSRHNDTIPLSRLKRSPERRLRGLQGADKVRMLIGQYSHQSKASPIKLSFGADTPHSCSLDRSMKHLYTALHNFGTHIQCYPGRFRV